MGEENKPDINEALGFLAGEIESAVNVLASQQAQVSVLACAVLALLRTHPDPSAFASEFRRYWRKGGDQHSNAEVLSAARHSYAEAMSDLEKACRVPLGVRPPDVAADPED